MKIGGLRVDTHEVHGPFCKVEGIKEFPDLIYNVKIHGPSPWCGGPRAAPVHGGPRTRPRRRLTGGPPERRPHAWNLTAVEEEGGGNSGEPHRLHEGAAEGRKRLGVSGDKRGGERSGEARGWCSPFYRGRGGAFRGEKGGNGRRQWP
jgi:hypothetical protein